MRRKILFSIGGGALVGLVLGLSTELLPLPELRDFQIALLEYSYQALWKVLPMAAMRALGTSGGEVALLTAIGAGLGGGTGLLLYGAASRWSRRWSTSPLAVSISITSGILFFMEGIFWSRVVLIHSSTLRMVSLEGWGMLLVSLAGGAAAGWGILKAAQGALRWRRTWRVAGLLVVIGLCLASLLGGSIGATAPSGTPPPIRQVVLLGGDGATWDVALPMIRAGKMPHLARLMEEGTWGGIRTTLPWKSPILWTSIATGKREEEHGIHDFVTRDRATQTVIPISVSSRKVKAIWEIVSQAGLRVDVVGWYGSWPVEPVNGTMVSDRLLRRDLPLADRLFPESRMGEVEEVIAGIEGLEELASFGGEEEGGEGDGDHEEWKPRRKEKVAAVLGVHLLEKDRPDLHLIYLREIDDMQHFYWHTHAARRGSRLARFFYGPPDPSEVERKGTRVEEAYEKLDAVLGKILERVGPETVVAVVSDHGGGIKARGELNFTLSPVLEQWGLLKLLPDREAVDWTQTRISDSTLQVWHEERTLFVNQRPEGPFHGNPPEVEELQLLKSVAHRLKWLKVTTGQPLVTQVRVVPASEKGPAHLSVRMNVRLSPKETVRGEGVELPLSHVVWPRILTGTHRLNGILAMAGPGIRPGARLRAASVLDVTPTLLYFLDLPVGEDMAGRVLLEAVEPGLKRARPVRWIPTHETGGPRAATPSKGSSADLEMLEELRSLGYVQ